MSNQFNLFRFEMPSKWTREKAWEVFQPYASRCFLSTHAGHDDWHNNTTEWMRGRLQVGDEAMSIASLIYRQVEEHFHDEKNACLSRQLGMRLLIIEDSIVVRFKRLDSNFTACPTNSPQDARWWRHEPIDHFPNYLLRLTVGHTLEGDNIDQVFLTWQPNVSRLGWAQPLSDNMEGGLGDPIEFAPPGVPPVPIVARQDDKRKEEGAG